MPARAVPTRAAALLCAALAGSAGLAAVAPTATAAGPAWTAAPETGQGGTRPYVYLEGTPGTVLQDRLTLTNPDTRPLTVRLRATAWTRLAAQTVTVPPRTRATVPFAVTVPADTPPGDHPGTLTASAGGRAVDVRLQLRVRGPALAAVGVEDVRVDTDSATIHYTLVNRGNTVLAPRLAVRADGLFTALDRPARPLPLTLRPGERVARTEPWPGAPALDAVTVRLTVTASGAAEARAETGALYATWPAVAGTAAGLGASAAGLTRLTRLVRRARYVRSNRRRPEPVAAVPGQELVTAGGARG
ncbi:hypothetical protein ACH44C_20970 [Streptomyces purpureus]|uniref:hypothetical protein n=1 Tax=Streptomyces purpureus TaxID=1951 RepID=UPI0037A0E2DB